LSAKLMPTFAGCNNRRNVGRGVFYAIRVVSDSQYTVKGK
jgi:hypothetical protein